MALHLDTYWDFLRKDRRVPLLIAGLLGLLILSSFWQLGAFLTHISSFRSTPAATSRTTANALPILAELHLFGKYNQNLENLPQTSLHLNLQGIALSVTPGDDTSRALIAGPEQPTKAYPVGATVPGGAIIRHIFRDRVILDDHGRLESLSLPVPKISGTITNVSQ